MRKNEVKDLTQGNVFKLILGFSIPLLFGMLFQQFYSMVDTIIVGRYLGVSALAEVGSTGSINFMIIGFCMGVCNGFAIPVAQKFGARNYKLLRKYVFNSGVMSVVFSLVMTLIVCLFCRNILVFMNTPNDIIDGAYSYIFVIFLGIPVTYLYNLLAGIIRSLGDSKTPLIFLLISSILNIILDLVFIINFKMGVAGAAYATIISQGVSAILCLIYTYKRFTILRLKKEDFNVKRRYYHKHLKIGIPMALQFSITSIGIMTVQGALNVFGSTVIASYTAASKALQLVMQPAITFGVTMATYCGQNLGAKEYGRIKEGVKECTKISIITSIIAGAVLMFLGKYFVMMFISNPDAEVLKYAQQVLDISAIFFIPLGLIFIYRNALQGIGDSFVPMMAGAYELIARALVAFILPKYLRFMGICLADPVAWFAASIPLGITYFRRIRSLLKHGNIKV